MKVRNGSFGVYYKSQSPLLESAGQNSGAIALLNFDATCGGRDDL